MKARETRVRMLETVKVRRGNETVVINKSDYNPSMGKIVGEDDSVSTPARDRAEGEEESEDKKPLRVRRSPK
jgi:hypothetical protein